MNNLRLCSLHGWPRHVLFCVSSTEFGMTAGSGTCTIGSSPELLESHYQSTGEKTDRCKSLEAYDHLARFVSTSGQLKNIGSEMEELRYKLKYVKRKLVAVLEETKLVVEKSPPL